MSDQAWGLLVVGIATAAATIWMARMLIYVIRADREMERWKKSPEYLLWKEQREYRYGKVPTFDGRQATWIATRPDRGADMGGM